MLACHARHGCLVIVPKNEWYEIAYTSVPHEACNIFGGNEAFITPIKALESSIRLKYIKSAQVLPSELNDLFLFASVGDEASKSFFCFQAEVCSLHFKLIII